LKLEAKFESGPSYCSLMRRIHRRVQHWSWYCLALKPLALSSQVWIVSNCTALPRDVSAAEANSLEAFSFATPLGLEAASASASAVTPIGSPPGPAAAAAAACKSGAEEAGDGGGVPFMGVAGGVAATAAPSADAARCCSASLISASSEAAEPPSPPPSPPPPPPPAPLLASMAQNCTVSRIGANAGRIFPARSAAQALYQAVTAARQGLGPGRYCVATSQVAI
jgi:hypothetical protein